MAAGQAAGEVALGAMFAHAGWCTLREPGPRVQAAAPLLARLRRIAPFLPGDQALVKANAAVHAAGGLLLAAGIFRRPAAVALLLSLLPTTAAGHAFWEVSDPGKREQEQLQFGKNMAVLGALVMTIAAPDIPVRR